MTALTWITANGDGSLLGIGAERGDFTLWSLREAAVVGTCAVGGFTARATWLPDGQLLIARLDGQLRLWDPTASHLVAEWDSGHGKLRGLACAAAGTTWATCGDDGFVRLWDPVTRQLRKELQDGKVAATAVGFVAGAVVVGYADGFFIAWTTDGSEKVAAGQVSREGLYSLGVHPAGMSIVFGGAKGGLREVCVGPPDAWKASRGWKDPPRPIAVNAIAFAPDGRMIVACSDDSAHLYDSLDRSYGLPLHLPFYMRNPKPAWCQDFIVSGACFVPGSEWIATSHFDGLARLWHRCTCTTTIDIGKKP